MAVDSSFLERSLDGFVAEVSRDVCAGSGWVLMGGGVAGAAGRLGSAPGTAGLAGFDVMGVGNSCVFEQAAKAAALRIRANNKGRFFIR